MRNWEELAKDARDGTACRPAQRRRAVRRLLDAAGATGHGQLRPERAIEAANLLRKIRYMSYSSTSRKFDSKAYIERVKKMALNKETT